MKWEPSNLVDLKNGAIKANTFIGQSSKSLHVFTKAMYFTANVKRANLASILQDMPLICGSGRQKIRIYTLGILFADTGEISQ